MNDYEVFETLVNAGVRAADAEREMLRMVRQHGPSVPHCVVQFAIQLREAFR